MKKIITAINNPKLNEELKKEKKFEIIGKDIQYKEAILEILEKNKNIDLIILSEKIMGEIRLEKLIKKIRLINEQIKIVFILEKENNYEEEKKKISIKKTLKKFKNKIQIVTKNTKKTKKNTNKSNNMSTKIISFFGNYKSGKSTLSLIISQYLSQKDVNVLLVDGDLEKNDLKIILKKNNKKRKKKNKYNKNKNKKIIKVENNSYKKFINKKNKIYYYQIKKIMNEKTKKINKNLYFFYGFNHLLKNEIIKKEKIIIFFLKIIKKDYDFIIFEISKNNLNSINQVILKNSQINFIMIEPNLLGIREMRNTFETYLKRWKIDKNSLHIIANKKNISSIHKDFIANCIFSKNKIIEIKENKVYSEIIKDYARNKFLLKNKKIKKEIEKIINKIMLKNNKNQKERRNEYGNR